MSYKRALNLPDLLKEKSLLLLGPRQTGKTTLTKTTLGSPSALVLNLAESERFRQLSARPELIRELVRSETRTLIIDEAQRVPEIFNEVQVLLDRNRELRVVLTGSSARKLRRTGVNLLPGRIWVRYLHPLVSAELGDTRVLERVQRGSLPGIIDAPNFQEELRNYSGLYLDEEIRAEGLTRDIGAFSRFLEVAALYNAEQVNFTNIANDTGIKLNTVRGYFEILSDTLIGHILPAFRGTKLRKAVASPKFYLFDLGVVNALLRRFDVHPGNELFGKAVEHIVFQELLAFRDYRSPDLSLSYWRSQSKFEVDFVLNDSIAIEVKSGATVTSRDERGLRALAEDIPLKRKIIVSREQYRRVTETGIEIIPIEEFLQELWEGGVIS